jgi:signal transduction histidine kinase
LQKSARETLDYFVRQVLTAQEDERRRIALELHDDTIQALLLSCQRLDGLVSGRGWPLQAEVAEELRDLRASTLQTLADLRRLTQDLQPRIVDDLGLVPALEWLTDELSEQHGIAARVVVSADLPELSQETQLILFRIAQEALRNVGRHSGASRASLSLRGYGDRIRMVVEDDGHGFRLAGGLSDLANRGKLGLLGMHERARLLGGSLQVRTAPGMGTTISVELPRGVSS